RLGDRAAARNDVRLGADPGGLRGARLAGVRVPARPRGARRGLSGGRFRRRRGGPCPLRPRRERAADPAGGAGDPPRSAGARRRPALSTTADAPLRANVRLLGDLLGQVLVEQEGEWLLELEERIRLSARDARDGDEAAFAQLGETVAALPLERQALVLRAFAVYFQLANIAEQHHRLLRRRQ